MELGTAVASAADEEANPRLGDKLAIAAALQKFERTWNEHQVSELEPFFTEDAECVSIEGVWWRGRNHIIKALEAVHATMFRTHDLDIRGIAPKVMIATETQGSYGLISRDGVASMRETLNRLTFVLVKINESWLIANVHGTVIDQQAQKYDPIQWPSLF